MLSDFQPLFNFHKNPRRCMVFGAHLIDVEIEAYRCLPHIWVSSQYRFGSYVHLSTKP